MKIGEYVDDGPHVDPLPGARLPGELRRARAAPAARRRAASPTRDFGKVYSGGPEVHADGEIWGETLWDMRQALGVDLGRSG